jgi:hypothetical protein
MNPAVWDFFSIPFQRLHCLLLLLAALSPRSRALFSRLSWLIDQHRDDDKRQTVTTTLLHATTSPNGSLAAFSFVVPWPALV